MSQQKHRGLMWFLMSMVGVIGSLLWGMSAKTPDCERPPDLF